MSLKQLVPLAGPPGRQIGARCRDLRFITPTVFKHLRLASLPADHLHHLDPKLCLVWALQLQGQSHSLEDTMEPHQQSQVQAESAAFYCLINVWPQ